MNKRLPLVLLILDGWVINAQKDGNAIVLAKIKNIPIDTIPISFFDIPIHANMKNKRAVTIPLLDPVKTIHTRPSTA